MKGCLHYEERNVYALTPLPTPDSRPVEMTDAEWVYFRKVLDEFEQVQLSLSYLYGGFKRAPSRSDR